MDEVYNVISITGKTTAIEFSKGQIQMRIGKIVGNPKKEKTSISSTLNLRETISLDVDIGIIQNSEFQEFVKGLERCQHVNINMDEVYNVISITGKKTAIEFSKGQIQTRIDKILSNSTKESRRPPTDFQPSTTNNHNTIELSVAKSNFLELFGQKILDTIRNTKGINNAIIKYDKLQLSGDISVIERIESYLEQILHEENIQITGIMKQHLESTNHGCMWKEFLEKYRVGSSLQGVNRGDKNKHNTFQNHPSQVNATDPNDQHGSRLSSARRPQPFNRGQRRGTYESNNKIRGERGGGNGIRGGRGRGDEIYRGRGRGNCIRGEHGRGHGIRGLRGRNNGTRGQRSRGYVFAHDSPSHLVEDLNTASTNSSQNSIDDYEEDEINPYEHEGAKETDGDNDDISEDSDSSLSSNFIKGSDGNPSKLITITLCSDSEDSLSKAVAELRSYSFCIKTWSLTEDEITFILKQQQRGKPQQDNYNSIYDRSVRIKSYLVQSVQDHSVQVYIHYGGGMWHVKVSGSKQRVQPAVSKIKSYLNDVVETVIQIPISKAMAFFLRAKASFDVNKLEKKHNTKITIYPPPPRRNNEDNNNNQGNDNNCLKIIGSIARVNSAQVDVQDFLENLLEQEYHFPCDSWDLAKKISSSLILPYLTKIQHSNDCESIGLIKFYNSPIERRETTPKITFTIVSLDKETTDQVIQQCTDIIEGYVVWTPSVNEYRAIDNILLVQKSPSISAFQQEWDTLIQLERNTNTITIPARSKMIADEIKEALQNLSKEKQVSVHRTSETIPVSRIIRRFVNLAIGPVVAEAQAQRVFIDFRNRDELRLHGFSKLVISIKEKITTIVNDIQQQMITHRLSLSLAESELFRAKSYEIVKRIERETNTNIRDVEIDLNRLTSNENNDDISLTITTVENNRGQTIIVKKGDITKAQDVDAIINAANGTLSHPGGVAKMISDAAGPAFDQECKQLIAQNRGIAISTGTAVKTTAGNLPFKSVIHAIGPQYEDGSKNERPLLFFSVLSSLRLAEEEDYSSVALPAISSVTYGFPLQDCTNIVIRAVKQFFADFPQSHVRKVILLDIDDSACNSFAREVINDHASVVDNDITNYEPLPPLTSKWCWVDDYGEKIYDDNHTRQIENALQQYLHTGIPSTLILNADNLKSAIIVDYSIHFLPNLKETLAGNPNAINARLVCGCQQRVSTNYKRSIIRYPLVQEQQAAPVVVYRPRPMDPYHLQVRIPDVDWNIMGTTKLAIQQAETNIRKAIESATVSEPFSVNLTGEIETHKNAIRSIAIEQSIQVDFQQDRGGKLTLILKGFNENVLKAKLKISLYAQDILQMEIDKDDQLSIPKEWGEQEEQCKLVEIPPNHPDFIRVENRMKETMSTVKIDKIERVQNLRLWNYYALRRQTLQRELSNKPDLQIEMELFHGTRNTIPSEVYNGEYGFDMTFCTDGLWGIGTYFARNASYSCPNYSYKLPDGKRQVFLAQVLTGEVHDYKTQNDKALRRPPKKNESISNVRYNSVSGVTAGTQVYIIYENRIAYPTFLITCTV